MKKISFLVSLVLFMSAPAVFAQATQTGAVLIRNVRLPDDTNNSGDVLVTGGKITRHVPGTQVPPNIPIINGAGNILILEPDGSIRLTPFTPTSSTEPAGQQSLASAQPQVAAAAGEQNLAQAVTDPTAALTAITYQNKSTFSHWQVDDSANEFDLQILAPIRIWNVQTLARVRVPYFTSTLNGQRGMGAVQYLHGAVVPTKHFTMLAGFGLEFNPHRGHRTSTLSAGPAFAMIFKKEKWTYGFLTQNFFSNDTKRTQIQPILSYTFNPSLSISTGDWQDTIDWRQDKFVSAPIGFQVNYIAKIADQPVRFFANPQYQFLNQFGAPKWQLTWGFALIGTGPRRRS